MPCPTQVHGLTEVLEPARLGAAMRGPRMGGWVHPSSRYGLQFRHHCARLMAKHHRDYAAGWARSLIYYTVTQGRV